MNEFDDQGESPLGVASLWGHIEIARLLINHSKKMRHQNLKHGILDINHRDSNGFTPLYVAAQIGHYSIVELLLENNVCPVYSVPSCNYHEIKCTYLYTG